MLKLITTQPSNDDQNTPSSGHGKSLTEPKLWPIKIQLMIRENQSVPFK